jgi:7,8-dihydropterin-6-yl-methyl-4-(beta-D-ribofuranosyl)aminobenzene 5'-phosphate synthase
MQKDQPAKNFLITMLGILLLGALLKGGKNPAGAAVFAGLDQPLRFTILYDNYLHREGTKPDWGFSCLIEGTEKTILFDTGTQPGILMHNIEVLGIDLKKVGQIVISHDHGDHTGGLTAVLEKNPKVTVFFPVSFPPEFGRRVESLQAITRAVDKPVEICRNVHLTGEMGDEIKEQSLIIDTAQGLIIVTGCSHQGIVNILKRAREIREKPILFVFGGFHLASKPAAEMQEIIAAFKTLKVEKCGATHCTGDIQISMFKKAFGENFIPMGTGRVIEVPGFKFLQPIDEGQSSWLA